MSDNYNIVHDNRRHSSQDQTPQTPTSEKSQIISPVRVSSWNVRVGKQQPVQKVQKVQKQVKMSVIEEEASGIISGIPTNA